MNAHYRPVPAAFSAEQLVDWHVDTLLPLTDEAARLGITIVLEHVPEGGARQLENFVEIMRRVPRLRFHLDSGHAKLEAYSDRFSDYLETLGSCSTCTSPTTTARPISICRREPCRGA